MRGKNADFNRPPTLIFIPFHAVYGKIMPDNRLAPTAPGNPESATALVSLLSDECFSSGSRILVVAAVGRQPICQTGIY